METDRKQPHDDLRNDLIIEATNEQLKVALLDHYRTSTAIADEHRQDYVDVVQGEGDREDLLSLVSELGLGPAVVSAVLLAGAGVVDAAATPTVPSTGHAVARFSDRGKSAVKVEGTRAELLAMSEPQVHKIILNARIENVGHS